MSVISIPIRLALVLALFTGGYALAQPASLGDLMSEQDMRRMGLDKLSPDEQQQLFLWITGGEGAAAPVAPPPAAAPAVAAPAAVSPAAAAPMEADPMEQDIMPPASDAPAPAASAAPAATAAVSAPGTDPAEDANFGKAEPRPDQMRSVIPGEFTGWTGDTTFTLANGQVWQQRYKTTWRTEMTDPEVIITRHLFGLHRMEIVGTGQTVPVKRIR